MKELQLRKQFREETKDATYCEAQCAGDNYFSDEYVLWLERKLVKLLNLHIVTQRSESLCNFHKWLGKYNQLASHSYNTKHIIETYEKLLNDG